MKRILLLAALLSFTASGAHANWTASGTFRYRDRIQDLSGFTGATQDLPIRKALVEVVRAPGTVLATGITDNSGNFSIPVIDNQTATVFCRVISIDNDPALGIRVQSSTSSSATYAVMSSNAANHNPNTNTDFGIVVAIMGGGGEAFNVFDILLDGSDYAKSLMGSYPPTTVTAVWSASSTTGSFFSGTTIRLLADDGWDDAVIAHEHGHFLDILFAASSSPGGPHFLGDNDQDLRLAYGEGVASYHMAAGRKFNGRPNPTLYIDTTGGSGAGNLGFSYEIEGPSVSAIGAASEVSVQAVLWDMVDDASDADGIPGDDDNMNVAPAELWEVMSVYLPTQSNISLEKFWDGWFSPGINNGFSAPMKQTWGALTIEFFEDLFEEDGNSGAAKVIAVTGVPQHHTFYPAGDSDFARFTSPAPGTQFVVETVNLVGDANTSIEIRDQNGTTVLAQNDNRGTFDSSSLVTWTAPAAGNYFVRSFHAADVGVYGSYDLRVVQGAVSPITFTDQAPTLLVNSSRPGRGSAWGDFDGDGDPDLFVTNAVGNAWHLYRNEFPGPFVDVAAAAGVAGPNVLGEQAVWGDYDNDGDLDLYVAVIGTNVLYRNEGNGTFVSRAAAAGVAVGGAGSLGASWADYDRDGHLDLFVATLGADNRLFRNLGNGTFSDVTAAVGLSGYPADSFGGVWADYDGDLDIDLFVHNDGSPNRLFRNDGAAGFADVTPPSMSEPGIRSWGATWSDYDNDGDFDLYVTTLGSPCRLYRNVGQGAFLEVGAAAGTAPSGSQTSNVAADFDFDYDGDFYVGAFDESNLYFDNLGAGAFYNSGKAANANQTRSSSAADYDGDGDLDIYVVTGNGANLLYQNSGNANPWIRLRLQGVQSNRAAIGATVVQRSAGRRSIQTVSGGSGYLSQNDLRLTFGLGGLAGPDTFEVRWPSGAYQVVTGLARNTTHTIVEMDQGSTGVPEAPPARPVLAQNTPNPFRTATTIRFTLSAPGPVALSILDVQGRLVRRLVDEARPAGAHEAVWDGRRDTGEPAGAGVYFYRLSAAGASQTRKLVMRP